MPDFVTALTAPPAWCPYWAGSALVSTLNSCIASGNGIGRLKLVVGSLFVAPSSLNSTPFSNAPAMETRTAAGLRPVSSTARG